MNDPFHLRTHITRAAHRSLAGYLFCLKDRRTLSLRYATMVLKAAPAGASQSQPLINLLRGWPSNDLHPVALLKKASQAVLSDGSVAVPAFEYGPFPGHPALRAAIAQWVTSYYSLTNAPSPERIAITGGASQNLACILQVFTDPVYTRNVWCVAPSYFLAFRTFDDSGFAGKLRSVPEDAEGVDIEFLRKQLEESERRAKDEINDQPVSLHPLLTSAALNPMQRFKSARPWRKIYRHIIYAVPTFANPSSRTMSMRRREQLVQLAREYDALVIADDVYDFLQWPVDSESSTTTTEHAVLPRLTDIDRSLDGGAERKGSDGFGNTASNASFSKMTGGGLRVSWVEGTPKFVNGVAET